MATLTRGVSASLLIALLAASASAHGLLHTVSRDEALLVTITDEEGSPFADQHYQVYFGDDTVAFQTGRTDALGRVIFVPDRAGRWRIRAFSQDGHGIDVVATTDAPAASATPTAHGLGARILTGLSLLFGIFGVVALFVRRRAAP